MQFSRKIAVVAVLMLLALGMTGCGLFSGESVPDTKDEDPTEVELLLNPGFEFGEGTVPASWGATASKEIDRHPFESGDVSRTPEAARSGEYGLKIVLDQSSGNYYMTQTVDVEGGKFYELSAWVNSDLGKNGRTGFKFELRDKDSNYIGAADGGELQKYWTDSTEGWEQHVFQVQMPNHAATARILVRLYGSGEAYFDDMSLKRIEPLD